MKLKNEYLSRVAVGSFVVWLITYAFGMSEGAILFGMYTIAIQQGYLMLRDKD